MKTPMKLFVWREYMPNYSGGLAVAIAENELEARKLVKRYGCAWGDDWGELTVYPLTSKFAVSVNGGA